MELKKFVFKILSFLFIFFLSIATVCSKEKVSSKEEEDLFVAQKAQEDGFYETALSLYERFLNNWPRSKRKAEVNLYIGQCYLFQKKYPQALKKLEDLLNDPEAQSIKNDVLYWMAEVHFQNNNFEQAKIFYRKIIDDFPESNYLVYIYYSLGWCMYELKNYDEALNYFTTVIHKFPQDNLAEHSYLKIMDCLYALKNYQRLKEFISSYLKDNSHKTNKTKNINHVVFYQAEAEYYLGNFETAYGLYNKLINDTREERLISLAKLGLGWCLIKMNKYKEAGEIFDQLESSVLDRKDYEILLLGKAYVFSQLQRFEDSLRIYNELIDSASSQNLLEAYLGKGFCLYNLCRYSEAIEVYNTILKIFDKTNTDIKDLNKVHYNLGWAYLKNGQFKEAIVEFQKVASLSDEKTIKIASICLTADTYQDSGQYERAISIYEEILRNYPDSLYTDYIQYQLGNCFLRLANYESAILAFRMLLANFPYSKLLDEATYALGLVYFQKEEFQNAIDVLKDFAKRFKDSHLAAEATYLYASSLYNTQRFGEAIEVFKSILRDYPEDKELVQKAEFEIADCLYQMGKEKEAINILNTLRTKYPDSNLNAEILWWLGCYYWRLNKFNLSKRYLETIIQDFPQSNILADVYYILGFIYAEENNYSKAIEFFNKTKSIGEPELTAQAMIAIGDILVRKTELSKAKQIYQQVIKDYPNLSGLVYPKIAEVSYSLGNFEEA
ncbi:MAG: tetratricopeptide repeat protein, partial [Candidatus Omnitrophica bacterium]|nr:tetratricopeptide repeat protein [Candidatus Omnitrophota bacterium]